MPNRTNDSTLSGSSANRTGTSAGLSPDVINPGISEQEIGATTAEDRSESVTRETSTKKGRGRKAAASTERPQGYMPDERPPSRELRGSGTDRNSDSRRLSNPDNLQDKMEEDTFPASDPPSTSPLTGMGRTDEDPSPNFKEDPQAQFEYGRRSQAATQHFDRSSRRLERGNPDIGDVDLGTIEADKPAQKDDRDLFDSADDSNDRRGFEPDVGNERDKDRGIDV